MARWDVFDIFLYGTSLSDQSNPAAIVFDLKPALQLQRPNSEIRVYQHGVSGATSASGYAARGMGMAVRPKCVVLEYAMNDALTANAISVATFTVNIGNFITAMRENNPGVVVALMTMNPAISPGAANVPNLAQYYQALRDLAVSRSCLLIDNAPLWGTPTSLQIPDGIHPTRAANLAVTLPTMVSRLLTVIPE